jgi:hypothetical protein
MRQQAAKAVLQRKCACGKEAAGGECAGCREKKLQRKAAGPTPTNEAPAIVQEVLRTPGRPLDAMTRTVMEPRFGHDFSRVRVHTDAKAAESAHAVNALAYTVGQDIVFGGGTYAPESDAGRHLLAHELTHAVQQQNLADLGHGSLQLGPVDDVHEREADEVSRMLETSEQMRPAMPLTHPVVQRDLARPPTGAAAPLRVLTPAEIQDAITFNQNRFSDPYSIRVIRDVVGVNPLPAVVDEELIQAVVQWQAERRMTQDGKIGHLVTRSIVLELIAERQFRDAVILIIDSYGLLTSLRLNDVRVGTGANCCGTAASPADAVTSGGVCPTVGAPVRVCVCQTSFPPAVDYNHFVRIVGHEMVHVPHCGGAAFNLAATEFEAFFFEACNAGRAPQLSAADRVGHATIALGHFAAIPPALQTPARVAMRAQLAALIAAGGVGPC